MSRIGRPEPFAVGAVAIGACRTYKIDAAGLFANAIQADTERSADGRSKGYTHCSLLDRDANRSAYTNSNSYPKAHLHGPSPR
jgi:hypothetical protein